MRTHAHDEDILIWSLLRFIYILITYIHTLNYITMNIVFLNLVSNLRRKQQIANLNGTNFRDVTLRVAEDRFDKELAQISTTCQDELYKCVVNMREAQREFRAHHSKSVQLRCVLLEGAVDGLVTKYQRQHAMREAQLSLFGDDDM